MCSILGTSTQRAASCFTEGGWRSRSAPFKSLRRGMMKLLLTSGGVTNPSIRDALVDLLGKPIAESIALCIPTAQWGQRVCGPTTVRGFVVGEPPWHTMVGLGWKSVGLLELTALPTIGKERW